MLTPGALRGWLGWAIGRLRRHGASAEPVPAAHEERVLYGLAQPVLGLRLLLRDRELLQRGLTPAFWLVLFCVAVALLGGSEGQGFIRTFYRTFAVLAPVPSILFANHYARLAATAHERLGLGPCRAREHTLFRSATHALRQIVVVAVAVAPLLGVLSFVPALGKPFVKLLAALWALHWILVEALDSARVLQAQGPDEPNGRPQDLPWFTRVFAAGGGRLPRVLGWPLRWFAALCAWLCRPWHDEIALCEEHPAALLGFALSTAALLATPVLNLLFRPITTLAGVHLIGRIQGQQGSGTVSDPQARPAQT